MIEVANVHHVNIDVRDVDRSVKFYEEVLGLKDGPAPKTSRPLHWVYAGDFPIIHISQSGADKGDAPKKKRNIPAYRLSHNRPRCGQAKD